MGDRRSILLWSLTILFVVFGLIFLDSQVGSFTGVIFLLGGVATCPLWHKALKRQLQIPNKRMIKTLAAILLLGMVLTGCKTTDEDIDTSLSTSLVDENIKYDDNSLGEASDSEKKHKSEIIDRTDEAQQTKDKVNSTEEDQSEKSNTINTADTSNTEDIKDNADKSVDTEKYTENEELPGDKKIEKKKNKKNKSKDKVVSTKLPDMNVHFVDVGQGDAIVVEADGHFMVIDAGENEYGTIVVQYLKSLGASKIDYVIGTHPHSDHIGGLDDVINNFEIGKVILSPKAHISRTYEDVINAMLETKLSITRPIVGDEYKLGNAKFVIIGPNGDYGNDLNNWSVGIKLVYGENSFVLYGDGELAAEYDIIDNGINLKADVIKAAHHGSDTSNSQAILKAVQPKFAVISVGIENQYGHPSREILDRFVEYGTQYFRTDEQGTIIVTSDGSNLTWNLKPSTSLNSGEVEKIEESTHVNSIKVEVTKTEESTADGTVAVYITETGTKYHSEGCSYLNKSTIETTLDSAISNGLDPCSKCNPPR